MYICVYTQISGIFVKNKKAIVLKENNSTITSYLTIALSTILNTSSPFTK